MNNYACTPGFRVQHSQYSNSLGNSPACTDNVCAEHLFLAVYISTKCKQQVPCKRGMYRLESTVKVLMQRYLHVLIAV